MKTLFWWRRPEPVNHHSLALLTRYQQFLGGSLRFPFMARLTGRSQLFAVDSQAVEVVGLAEEVDATDGIRCLARRNGYLFEIPLHRLQVVSFDRNDQLLIDYVRYFNRRERGEQPTYCISAAISP